MARRPEAGMSEKKDLREVLRKVEAEGELVRITREVDPLDEIPTW